MWTPKLNIRVRRSRWTCTQQNIISSIALLLFHVLCFVLFPSSACSPLNICIYFYEWCLNFICTSPYTKMVFRMSIRKLKFTKKTKTKRQGLKFTWTNFLRIRPYIYGVLYEHWPQGHNADISCSFRRVASDWWSLSKPWRGAHLLRILSRAVPTTSWLFKCTESSVCSPTMCIM